MAALTAAVCIAAPVSALAAATLTSTTGTPLTYMLHDQPGSTDNTTVTVDSKPGSYQVNYTSSVNLHEAGNDGQGFAQVTAETGDFPDLTITPDSPLAGFTDLKFRFDTPTVSGSPDFTFDLLAKFSNGTTQTFTDTPTKGDNRFLLDGNGLVITLVTLSNLVATDKKTGAQTPESFEALKQVSFDAAAVPEPAAWGLMLVGFFGVGGALRARRKVLVAQA